jgi:CBS domain-containing protein
MLKSVELMDYVIPDPHTTTPDADLFDAIEIIIHNKISGLCVIDENGQLVGVLSELDCLNAILKSTYAGVGVGKVSEYMTRELECAHPGEDIVDVATDMLKKNQRRRPVVADDKLLGQITCRHLLSVVKDFSMHADHD